MTYSPLSIASKFLIGVGLAAAWLYPAVAWPYLPGYSAFAFPIALLAASSLGLLFLSNDIAEAMKYDWGRNDKVRSFRTFAARPPYPLEAVARAIFLTLSIIAAFSLLSFLAYKHFGSQVFSQVPADVSWLDWLAFGTDNFLRVVLMDIPEVYGIQISRLSHNTEQIVFSSIILAFRIVLAAFVLRILFNAAKGLVPTR